MRRFNIPIILAMALAISFLPAASDDPPSVTITAPDGPVTGTFDVAATTTVEANRFRWAVRSGNCSSGTTLAGNVDGQSSTYTYDGEQFQAMLDAADLPLADLCLRVSADLWEGVTHPRITVDQWFRVDPSVVITAPGPGATISETSTDLAATTSHEARRVQWAVRSNGCAGTTVAGNVDGFSDAFSYDGQNFEATIGTSEPGEFCFLITTDFRRADASNQRITTTRMFTVDEVVLCKDGGHASNFDPPYRNQGQCVRDFRTDS